MSSPPPSLAVTGFPTIPASLKARDVRAGLNRIPHEVRHNGKDEDCRRRGFRRGPFVEAWADPRPHGVSFVAI